MGEAVANQFGVDKTGEELLEEARENMLYTLPFFGTLALELDLIRKDEVVTSCTDGKAIRYSEEFVNDLTYESRQYLIAHEVLHCALHHHIRIGGRDVPKWNRACDIVVDKILIDSGFNLPAELAENFNLMMQHGDKTAEEVYALLDDDEGGEEYQPPTGDGDGDEAGHGGKSTEDRDGRGGNPSGDPFGGIEHPSDDADPSCKGEQKRDWEGKVSKASAVAKRMGKGGLSLDRVAAQLKKQNELNWKQLLRDFVERISKGDYTWAMPNRRYLTTCGLYLPALHSRECGKIIVAIDTSGSIGSKELAVFEAELNTIFSEFPSHVVVMWCDSRVAGVDEFRAGDILKFEPKGGGGTDFRPVFKLAETEHSDAECLIYFTDGYGSYPEEYDKPALWVMTEKHEPQSHWYPPFGKVLEFKDLDNE